MAEINLGDFPFYGGVSVGDASAYVGNNRFFRLVSQRDNDSTIGVMYETSDVFDNNATTTQICSEVLYAGRSYTGIKITQLGDGRIVVFAKQYSTNFYHAFIIEYDDVNNTFIKSDEIYLSNTQMNVSNYNYLCIQPYDQDTVFIVASDPNTANSLIKVVFGSGTATTTTIYTMNSTSIFDSPYYHSSNHSLNIIDDKVYLRNSCYGYSYSYVYDITGDFFDTNQMSYFPYVCKLLENKYVIVRYENNTATLQYSLQSSLPTRSSINSGPYSQFIPTVSSITPIYNDAGRILETFKLDDQHIIIFDKPGYQSSAQDSNIYARVVKIVDENYAYVSDNSNGADGVIVTSNYAGYYTTMSNFYNGKVINRVDDQRFYIQTNTNAYEFFTLTT